MRLEIIKNLCSVDEEKLKRILYKFLSSHGYKNIKKTNDYIIAEGTYPICLIAHMDTVFSFPPYKDNFIYDDKKKILWSYYGAGFDDRAGIYAIIEIIKAGFNPSVIFTTGEEIGGVGAYQLINDYPICPFNCNALIQLDRMGKQDMVFYQCDNPDFENYIGKYGFDLAKGTFTDISIIAPQWGIAAVNLSIGYEDEHTTSERLHCDWCDETIKKVKNIIAGSQSMRSFSYIPAQTVTFNNKDNNSCIFCGLSSKDNFFIKDSDLGFDYYCCPSCYYQYNVGPKEVI